MKEGGFVASKEQVYEQQLRELGIYEDAYKTAIKELCMLERELKRARDKLKEKHKDKNGKVDDYAYFTDPLYGVVKQIQSSVLAYKDALGLTPKALKKLKGKSDDKPKVLARSETPLSLIINKQNDRKSNTTA